MFHRFPPDLLEIGNRLPLTSLLNDPLQPFPVGIVEYDDISPSVIADAKLLCREAMRQVCSYLSASPLYAEVQQGKMLGVLLCRKPSSGEVGFLAAYSGQLGGREDWPWFVPAVFDYLQPDGHFKQEEARISDVGKHIVELQQGERRLSLCAELENLRQQAADAIDAYRWEMALAKRRRDEQRRAGGDEALLTRESQFQKAEMRRMKQMWAARISEEEARLKPIDEEISALAGERRERSERLQQWLFDRFVMLNDGGESRTLTSIFADTPQRVPPSGAGECCAPKLFQYAFANGLQPLVIAEFWQGASPRMEIRHHGQCYAACRGKCKPILEWMLEELRVLGGAKRQSRAKSEELRVKVLKPQAGVDALCRSGLEIVYEDADVMVVDKPSGMLSVPGRTGEPSVQSLLSGICDEVHIVHRLDQDTSGLMVVALNAAAYHHLQRQFMQHTISKRYIALVSCAHQLPASTTISLPLRPDPLDRPRQVVDPVNGKTAVTRCEVIATEGCIARLALMPLTGRTHQLRMHCAHVKGLNAPIVGDRLYGWLSPNSETATRLCLHAEQLTFVHPVSAQEMTFKSVVPF